MAQYRNGIKTQSYITDVVDENSNYQFWVTKGTGRYPKFDEETKESHLDSLFSLKYDEPRLQSILIKDTQSGGNIYGSNLFSYYRPPVEVEREFLKRVKAKLESAGVPCSFIARGVCSRRGKQAWQFKTVEYFIKAEKNAVLLKLMGIEQLIEDVWQSLEDEVNVFYVIYEAEMQRIKALNSAIAAANNQLRIARNEVAAAQRNRENALRTIQQADELETAANEVIAKAIEELEKLNAQC